MILACGIPKNPLKKKRSSNFLLERFCIIIFRFSYLTLTINDLVHQHLHALFAHLKHVNAYQYPGNHVQSARYYKL